MALSTGFGEIPAVDDEDYDDLEDQDSHEWDRLALEEWLDGYSAAPETWDAPPPPSFQWEDVSIAYAHQNEEAWRRGPRLPEGMTLDEARRLLAERARRETFPSGRPD